MNVKEFFIKIILMMVVLLSMLAFVDIIALLFSIRPQSVIIYLALGVFSSYIGYRIYEKMIERKDDPLPDYVMTQVRESNKKLEIMEEIMEEYGVSKEELKMRSKLREENGRERHREDRDIEAETKTKEIS